MDVIRNSSKIKIMHMHALIIQVFINLVHIMDCGQNAGHAAKENGEAKVAEMVCIKEFYWRRELCYA
jgi:hypothetical protein